MFCVYWQEHDFPREQNDPEMLSPHNVTYFNSMGDRAMLEFGTSTATMQHCNIATLQLQHSNIEIHSYY
jgi:hypothetical protein